MRSGMAVATPEMGNNGMAFIQDAEGNGTDGRGRQGAAIEQRQSTDAAQLYMVGEQAPVICSQQHHCNHVNECAATYNRQMIRHRDIDTFQHKALKCDIGLHRPHIYIFI